MLGCLRGDMAQSTFGRPRLHTTQALLLRYENKNQSLQNAGPRKARVQLGAAGARGRRAAAPAAYINCNVCASRGCRGRLQAGTWCRAEARLYLCPGRSGASKQEIGLTIYSGSPFMS